MPGIDATNTPSDQFGTSAYDKWKSKFPIKPHIYSDDEPTALAGPKKSLSDYVREAREERIRELMITSESEYAGNLKQEWQYEGEPTTDKDTGAMKGRKDVELFTAPPYALAEYGKVCSYGSNGKYAPNNWRLGFQWSLSANAMLRHYLAWVGGEDLDPESGLHHLAHAAWHCLVLVQYSQDHPEKDDRFGMPACPATNGGK